MKKTAPLLILILLGSIGLGANIEQVFIVSFDLNRTFQTENVNIAIEPGDPSIPGHGNGRYWSNLLDSDNRTIFTSKTLIQFQRLHIIGGITNISEIHFMARLPYNSNATWFRIQNSTNHTKVAINLQNRLCIADDGACSSYCSGRKVDLDCTCGNNICDAIEQATTCQPDCGAPPNDTTTEPVDRPGGDGEQQEALPVNPLIFGVILLIAGGLLYYLAREVEVQ
ncbi:MAG: hypothetical protein SVU32_05350 [Candidatus Nanohaloarchaea archaeon]|nr:hypothetical protein [Candidatus Nanohaloarchaea archaeon]